MYNSCIYIALQHGLNCLIPKLQLQYVQRKFNRYFINVEAIIASNTLTSFPMLLKICCSSVCTV